jgi:hypothetical protein
VARHDDGSDNSSRDTSTSSSPSASTSVSTSAPALQGSGDGPPMVGMTSQSPRSWSGGMQVKVTGTASGIPVYQVVWAEAQPAGDGSAAAKAGPWYRAKASLEKNGTWTAVVSLPVPLQATRVVAVIGGTCDGSCAVGVQAPTDPLTCLLCTRSEVVVVEAAS